MVIKSGNIVFYVVADTLFIDVVGFLTSVGKIKSATAVVLAFASGKPEVDIGV